MNFEMMILRKNNIGTIWYSVTLAANLYLPIFVWSSDFLSFAFMNVVIRVYYWLLSSLDDSQKLFIFKYTERYFEKENTIFSTHSAWILNFVCLCQSFKTLKNMKFGIVTRMFSFRGLYINFTWVEE